MGGFPMPDTIVRFALRGAADEELGGALGRCFAEYAAWHGQSVFVAGFAQDALAGDVKAVIANRLQQGLEFGEAEGLFLSTPARMKSNREIAQVLADQQLAMAEQGVKIAAIDRRGIAWQQVNDPAASMPGGGLPGRQANTQFTTLDVVRPRQP
jgi:hypothetical protein